MKRAKSATKVDGRHARAERTHRAILDALLDLIDEGTPQPTAKQVAARAGVALRSIRQHFESREALFIAAAQIHAERVGEMSQVDPAAAFEERLAAFATHRARALERTAAIRHSASIVEHRSDAIASILQTTVKRRRQELSAAFAPELSALDAPAKKLALDGMDWASSGKAWDYAREEMGLDEDAAARLLRASVAAALGRRAG